MSVEAPVTSTRRGVLALFGLGTTAIAGCSELPTDAFRNRPIQLDGAELRSLANRTAPTVPETMPVEIEQDELDTRAEHARSLLSTAPVPFSSREIPNGAIREELTAMHERAIDALDSAENAESPYEAMKSLRSARSQAGALSAAWSAIDAGLTRETLLDDTATVRQEIRDFRNRFRYVGGDLIRAVVVYETVERGVERATAETAVDPEEFKADQENPITVGELGGDIERARAFLDDVAYLHDQYTDSLTETPDVGSTIRSASDAIITTIETRRENLPEFDPNDPSGSVGRDISDTPATWALQDLYDDATHLRRIADERSSDQPATVILLAQKELARIRGFVSLYDRVEKGERFVIENASDVRPIRSAAVRAVETTLTDATYPRLARHALPELAMRIRFADRELADVEGEIEPRWIARDVGRYVTATAIARAVSAATERIATTLENTR